MTRDQTKTGLIVKNKPLISVIITNYNYGQFVTEAMSSVLAQTYRNIELVIINDGSTDNSVEVIKRFIANNPGRNIKFVNRKNMGIVYTRNEGIRIAKGDYISFLDADDYFDRTYISRSYKIAVETGVDVVYPNWRFVGDWLGRPNTDFPEFTSELLQMQKLHVTPASLIKKSAVKNRKFEAEKVAEDWDFFIGLSLDGGTFKLAKDNHINYRIRKGTRSSKNDPKEDTKNFVEILEKYKKVYGDKVIKPSRLVADRHPSLVVLVLRKATPSVIYQSIKNHGIKYTLVKIFKKLASRIKWLKRLYNYRNNYLYYKNVRTLGFTASPKTKLAVIVHLYYPESWPLISEKLQTVTEPFDLFVSVQHKDKGIELGKVSNLHGTTNIITLPNRGRDVLPFLVITRRLKELGQYKYILKLHSKKSPHRSDGSLWFNDLLSELLPSNNKLIIKTLAKRNTGVIGPSKHIVSLSKYMGGNRNHMVYILEKIAQSTDIDHILLNQDKYPFFGGTMFWCKLDFLDPLTDSDLSPSDFIVEKGQTDTTTAHALERILGRSLHKLTNKKIYSVNKSGKVVELPVKSYDSKYKFVE